MEQPKEEQGLILNAFRGSVSSFKSHLVEFLWSVPVAVKNSFHDVEACLASMDSGCHRQFLRLVGSSSAGLEVNDTLGLACLNIDHTCMTERRAYIRHISVRHREQFLDALHLVLKHAWTALKADTVRIDLYHFEDESNPGQVQADKEIKADLGMNRRGFKWKTLINDIKTGKRY